MTSKSEYWIDWWETFIKKFRITNFKWTKSSIQQLLVWTSKMKKFIKTEIFFSLILVWYYKLYLLSFILWRIKLQHLSIPKPSWASLNSGCKARNGSLKRAPLHSRMSEQGGLVWKYSSLLYKTLNYSKTVLWFQEIPLIHTHTHTNTHTHTTYKHTRRRRRRI